MLVLHLLDIDYKMQSRIETVILHVWTNMDGAACLLIYGKRTVIEVVH